jgi:hypothetical protein
MRLEGQTPARIEEIKSLALRHGIVTEFTAYLVQEPVVASNAPGNMPRGVDDIGRLERPRTQGAPAPASPAVSQTGKAAFEQAQTSADMAAAGSVSAARRASERAQNRVDTEQKRSDGVASQRIVGSRRFEQQGTQWTDMTQRSQRIVNVEAFSPAYFALLRLLPELRDASQLGDDVLVAGQRVSIRLQRTGQARLAAAEVSQLAKDFRGA